MALSVNVINNISTITPSSESDIINSSELNQIIDSIFSENIFNIIIDMSQFNLINSMGIGIIAKTALKVNKSYGKLSVIITNDRILQLFSISEMSKIMHISNSIDESINFFNKKD